MNFWNKKDLNGPPILTYVTKQRMLNLREYHMLFHNAINFTGQHDFLGLEQALLSRYIYKMKWKFSKDKFLNAMQKTNKALLLYLQLDLPTLLTSYRDSVPTRYEEETHFPTIDMLDFVLVRLQGVSKLLVRMRDCASTAALYLGDKFVIGHVWEIVLLNFALVSRLMQTGNEICRYFCDLYDKLLTYRSHFRNVGEKWLPDDYPFPASLQTWLDVDFDVFKSGVTRKYDLTLAESIEAYATLNSIEIDSDSNSDVEMIEEYILLDDVVRKAVTIDTDKPIINIGSDMEEDMEAEMNQSGNLLNEKLGAMVGKAAKTVKANPIIEIDSDVEEVGEEIDQFGNLLNEKLSIIDSAKRGRKRKRTATKQKIEKTTTASKSNSNVRTTSENSKSPKQSNTVPKSILDVLKKQKVSSNNRPLYIKDIKRLNRVVDLHKFVTEQSMLRIRRESHCFYLHLSNPEWKKLKLSVLRLLKQIAKISNKEEKQTNIKECQDLLYNSKK